MPGWTSRKGTFRPAHYLYILFLFALICIQIAYKHNRREQNTGNRRLRCLVWAYYIRSLHNLQSAAPNQKESSAGSFVSSFSGFRLQEISMTLLPLCTHTVPLSQYHA